MYIHKDLLSKGIAEISVMWILIILLLMQLDKNFKAREKKSRQKRREDDREELEKEIYKSLLK